MIKGLDKYCAISNKELQGIKGGFGVGVGIAFIYGRLHYRERYS